MFFSACENGRNYASKNGTETFRDKEVQYTRHARCLMQCRKISEKEIQNLISTGKINEKESFPKDKPCPTYAVEGLTSDSQNVRVIVGECAGAARVITLIALDKEQKCTCQ